MRVRYGILHRLHWHEGKHYIQHIEEACYGRSCHRNEMRWYIPIQILPRRSPATSEHRGLHTVMPASTMASQGQGRKIWQGVLVAFSWKPPLLCFVDGYRLFNYSI